MRVVSLVGELALGMTGVSMDVHAFTGPDPRESTIHNELVEQVLNR